MNKQRYEVSVILCTYNRCVMLRRALEGLLKQAAGEVGFEIVVVDNNSSDATRATVESFIAAGHENLRYLFEARQGKSFALNTAIEGVQSAILAFTDDDVIPATNWIAEIKRAFDAHPEVDFVGGKVLPIWEQEPPAWLTKEHWAPLSLTDLGDASAHLNRTNPHCLVGANLAVRRAVFEKVGMFGTHVGRFGNDFGSCEDHEFEMRVWRAGGQGLYVPQLIVYAEIEKERLTKAYHRKWYKGHGRSMAVLRMHEITAADGSLRNETEIPESLKLYGTPAHVYRNLLARTVGWAKERLKGNESRAFWHESEARDLLAYINRNRELRVGHESRSDIVELLAFAKT